MRFKFTLFFVLLSALPVFAQEWNMNRIPPDAQEKMATCYAIYGRTEEKGPFFRNRDLLKKLGMHDQIISHPAYEEGMKIPFENISRDQKDACKMLIYGMIGEAEMLFTKKQPKYPHPNVHYCLGYFKTVFNRGDAEQSYCHNEVCRDRGIAGCVDKCVKKVREFKSFKMGVTDGKMVDYKQMTACALTIAKGK